ncbi:ankyrin repeat-containing domain protein [Hypomontagnella monticulosa]|nr:ankyrin repeat-containing domain protein [Hypomontagnella monticulosa]
MEFNIQLPGDAIERRRLQNRIAQRRFRQKRDPKRHVAVTEHGVDTDDHRSPGTHVNQLNHSQPTPSRRADVDPESDSIQSPAPLLAAGTPFYGDHSSNNHFEDASLGLGDIDSWDVSIVDGYLPNIITGPTPETSYPSPSQILRDLDLTPNTAHSTSTNSAIAPPLHSNTDGPRPRGPSPAARKPLRHRRSAQLNELLKPAHRDDDDGWLGSLHIAARGGRERIVGILLEQGEDCNEQDSDGRTPLMHAAIGGHDAVVDLLLARGARIALADRDARSALHWAALYRREGIMRTLLKRRDADEADRLDIDAYDDSGWTPIHMAICTDFEAGVTMLLRAGARLDSKAQKCPYTGKFNVRDVS